jgi:hypothetical protein
VQLTQIEAVFRSLKTDLGIRPIYHRLASRVDAHILVAFLAYCLQVMLKNRLQIQAPGLTPTEGALPSRVIGWSSEFSSMSGLRLSCWSETLDQQEQRDSAKCQPGNDTEAIHKRQQTHLMLKLLVEVTLRGGRGIRT